MKPYVGLSITTAVIVVAIGALIYTNAHGTAGSNLATVDMLDRPTENASATTVTMASPHDGCLFVTVDGVRAYAIWPKGSRQNGSAVLAPDGTRYVAGDEFAASVGLTSREGLGYSAENTSMQSPLSMLTRHCLADAPQLQSAPIALVVSIP